MSLDETTRLLMMRGLLHTTQAQLKRAVDALEFLPEVCNVLENPDWDQSDIQQFTNEFYAGMSTWLALSKLPTPADALEAKDEPETPSQILRQRDLERARRVEAEQKLAVTMEALDHIIDASDGGRDPEGYFYTVAANATNEVRSGAQGCVKYPLPKRKET